jgi:hypothetical protein
MRGILFAILVLALIAGCKPAPAPQYFQPVNTTAVIKDTEIMSGGVKVCDIQGTDYYIKDHFIYIYTTQNISTIITRIGTYSHNKVKDNWELLPFLDKENNVYWDTLAWIEDGRIESGPEIVCRDEREVPKIFYKFYKVYKPIYDKAEKSNTTQEVF